MPIEIREPLRRLVLHYQGARGLWRELLALAICLGLGLLLMPCLIFIVGRLALGAYARGDLFALWHDFLQGLVSGSHAAWFIVLGPYLLLWLLRAGRRLLRQPAT